MSVAWHNHSIVLSLCVASCGKYPLSWLWLIPRYRLEGAALASCLAGGVALIACALLLYHAALVGLGLLDLEMLPFAGSLRLPFGKSKAAPEL